VRAAIKEGRIEEDLDSVDDIRTAYRVPSGPLQKKDKDSIYISAHGMRNTIKVIAANAMKTRQS
jgi:hypothetical protein